MKCFWIGEQSELYIGKSIQDINEHYGCELMQEDIKNNNFGEITDMNSVVIFSDDGDADEGMITIGELIKEASTVRQIASAYC